MKAYIAIIIGILLLAVVGCTPEQEAKAIEICKTASGNPCRGIADICKEYTCVNDKCTIINLADCCGNKMCESNETWTKCNDCEPPYYFERLNITSCRENGKVKVIEFGKKDSMPTRFIEPLITELREKYPIEFKFYSFVSGEELVADFETMEVKTDLVEKYDLKATPTFIINCNIKREGGDKNGFEDLIKDALGGVLV